VTITGAMAPPIKTPRERWISEGLDALADGGPGAVRIEVLAERIGVSKGGFYGHFADRQALLEAMLDTWEMTIVDDVIAQLDTDDGAAAGDARSVLRKLFSTAVSIPDWLLVDLAIRDWARRDTRVAARLARVDKRRMDYLRSLFRQIARDDTDAEARSLLAASLWIGSHFVATGDGKQRREDALRTAFEWIIA
jgi:AcrR family transcriptional regulator